MNLKTELNREEFRYVVSDFRLNKSFDNLKALSQHQKEKCRIFSAMSAAGLAARTGRNATRRLAAKSLGEDCPEHYCTAPDAGQGYLFSKAIGKSGIYRSRRYKEYLSADGL